MPEDKPQKDKQDFEALSHQGRSNIVSEFWQFLKHNKKWWLLPIILVLLLLTLIVVTGGALGLWIYPLL